MAEQEFSEDLFEAMLDGSFEPEEAEEAEAEADVEEEEDETDNDEQHEDTDQDEESEEDEELDEAGDGELDEDSDDEEDAEEEDTPVESDDLDDEDEDTESEDDEDDESEESNDEDLDEAEDDTDTEEPIDGEAPDTDVVDYKAFYDKVTQSEFVVNGKKVKGFTDPDKIIQSQQMAGGFSEKMAGFKKYRQFMSPLKERGMLEDSAKFDLAMNLLDGDREAIKTHLKSLSIDPLELDMDTIDYQRTAATASEETMIIEDVMERAKSSGVEERVREVVGKDWDAESFQEFIKNPSVRNDLLDHIESGAYDSVQEKMAEMSRLDYNGSFGQMNTISKYREAVKALQGEYVPPKEDNVAKVAQKAAPAAPKAASVKAEKAKIVKARKEQEYKAKAAEQESKRMEQRKRATSSSKAKTGTSKAKKKFDPMDLEGDDFDSHFENLISGGR